LSPPAQFHGKGHLTLPAGKTYSGEWVSGKRDGIGTTTFVTSGL
jgi:hypothetical protein